MFHQILIQPQDRDAQRFLWRDGNTLKPPEVYTMEVMTFGATCSAHFIKNKNAADFIEKYPRAVKAIMKHHYVDDFVDSFDDIDEAIEVSSAVKQIHNQGGFELRDFVSNSDIVAETLNGHNKTPEHPVSMNMESSAGTEKILGMYWDTKDDTLKFQLKFLRVDKDVLAGKRRPTKRELLSMSMSVFDPFGLLANFMIHSKVMLQKVWKSGIGWDQSLPDDIYKSWLQWQKELGSVKEFRLSRCYSPYLSIATDVQLHTFVDASENAFAAVCYFRIQSANGIQIAFVNGKTRCAPLKHLSVPRLELQSAVLGIRLCNNIIETHDGIVSNRYFWCDSSTVINWIHSDHRRYKPFVAHRIAEILESSRMSEWRWIPSKQNAADDATRAKYPARFDPRSRWVNGPKFLQSEEKLWPSTPEQISGHECEEELRAKHVLLNQLVGNSYIIDLTKFSDYRRLKRTTAWCLRFINNCQPKRYSAVNRELTVLELQNAEHLLCRQAQLDDFANEIKLLINGETIDKSSSLYRLTAVLGEGRLLRISGRIDAATAVPITMKGPIILSKGHSLTQLIVTYYHNKLFHQNQEATVNEIRQRFWIPDLRSLVKRTVKNCQVCKNKSVMPKIPLMGQLPKDRVTRYIRPFTYTGLDYFGPFYVSVGRRKEKRWVALFTCLTVRAVHLELAADLSTDACLLCIRNFVNRRGIPSRIRSDNGTNFVGAKRELPTAIDDFDNDKIQAELSNQGIEWIFNCPGNPHAGGCWERLVQSVKRVLACTLHEQAPRVETLRSLLIEAECIVNSRPLTHLPVSSDEEEPLTPNHFLIGTMNSTQTPGSCDDKLWSLRKQWRIAQQLKNRFWKRWIQEYLPTLTRRTKWHERVEPIKTGDLVIICDNDQPRSKWQRGRVVQTFPGPDGQVRTAAVKSATSILRKPVSKLAILDVVSREFSDPVPLPLEDPGTGAMAIHRGRNVVGTSAKIVIGGENLDGRIKQKKQRRRREKRGKSFSDKY